MELSTREHREGKLGEKQLARALETLRTDGYVVLEEVVPKSPGRGDPHCLHSGAETLQRRE